jgi:hypothetical protein
MPSTVSHPSSFHTLLQRGARGLVLAAALAASAAAWADPPARVGRISETVGTVWFFEPEQGEWVQAQRNRPVTQGDRFNTDRGGRVEVQIGSTTVRIGGGSELAFTELDDEHLRLQLTQGSVALHLRRDEAARDVAVLTRQGRFEPLQAGRYRVDADNRSVFGAATEGAMRYESRDSTLTIGQGQRAEFWLEGGDRTHYAWTDMPSDRFADWVRQEEREDSERRAERERERGFSSEMTGADDLHRYGEWDEHPRYGSIWYPRGVSSGWAPYRDGRWAYVRPWGWTWVDNAPWGFAPFHYGRWVHHAGRWGWCPGQYTARPVYAPALVGWIGNGNVSVNIRIGGPGYVGWVPLSPYDVYRPHYHVPVTPVYIRNINHTHHHWHNPPRYPHHPRPGEPIMHGGNVQYTHQGVANGVTVVSRDVLRQRQPISAAVMASVPPATVAAWQRVQPDAPAGFSAAPRVAPPSPIASRVVAEPVVVLPAQTRTVPNAAPIPNSGFSQGPIPVRRPDVVAPVPPVVAPVIVAPGAVNPPQRVISPHHDRLDRKDNLQRHHRAQEQKEQREHMHQLKRHAPPGQQRND